MKITKDAIESACTLTPWEMGNRVLYQLCKEHREHDTPDSNVAIIAKIWLIGRAYAASIERKAPKEKGMSSEDFYEKTVVAAIKGKGLDNLLQEISDEPDPEKKIITGIKVHCEFTKMLKEISKMNNRSLASKYLHFHNPDAFFIFDSRARAALRLLEPKPQISGADIIHCERDAAYAQFALKCLWLKRYARDTFNQQVSPRQIDNLLLRAYAENKVYVQ